MKYMRATDLQTEDLVYDQKGQSKLYRGIKNDADDTQNIPLESRALVTEQQLNYLAKDIRDYITEGNYVSYNANDNKTLTERENAIDNIFGDGVLENKFEGLLSNLQSTAKGLTILDEEEMWLRSALTDVANGKRKLFYLTDKAVIENGGIPIISEYFRDVNNYDVIYKKSTYENQYNSNKNDWKIKYANKIKNSNNIREKLKWHFADFYRVGQKNEYRTQTWEEHWAGNLIEPTSISGDSLLNGLYCTQKGGSLAAFCEYIPVAWKNFTPEIFDDEDSLNGALLYQPSTGKIFEVQSNSENITVNTLLGLRKEDNSDNYRYSSIYGYSDKIIENFNNNNTGIYTFFESEFETKFELLDQGLKTYQINPDSKNFKIDYSPGNQNKATILNRYIGLLLRDGEGKLEGTVSSSNYSKNIPIISEENRIPIFGANKENWINIHTYEDDTSVSEVWTYPIFYVFEGGHKNTLYNSYSENSKSISTVYQSRIPRITTNLETYFNNNGGSSAPIIDLKWQGSPLFRNVINEARPRVFYIMDELDPEIYGNNISQEYPKGTMALHCISKGSLNNRTIWKFIGETLYSGGIEYPADINYYERLLGNNVTLEIKKDDYIYNPYSTELRRIYRPSIQSELTKTGKTFLTESVYRDIQGEADGIKRTAGTYLRGNNLCFMNTAPEQYNEGINLFSYLPKFLHYIFDNSYNSSQPNYFGYAEQFREKIRGFERNILEDDSNNTKKVFNTLYLLPKSIQQKVLESKSATGMRFKQLNLFKPGDFILAIENNNYNLYQITSAPFLYDIFKNDDLAKILFINFDCLIQARQGEVDYSVLFYKLLQSVLINEIENEYATNFKNFKFYYDDPSLTGESNEKPYNFSIHGNSISYFQNRSYFTQHCKQYNSLTEWLEAIKNDFPKLDVENILVYKESQSDEEYYNTLRKRLLTNLQCPIAIDAIQIATLPSLIKIGDEIIEELSSRTIIFEDNSISEPILSSSVQDKLNNFNIYITENNYIPNYNIETQYYTFENCWNNYNISVDNFQINDIILCDSTLYQVKTLTSNLIPNCKKIGSIGNPSEITFNQLETSLQEKISSIDSYYKKPIEDIPEYDLQNHIQYKLNNFRIFITQENYNPSFNVETLIYTFENCWNNYRDYLKDKIPAYANENDIIINKNSIYRVTSLHDSSNMPKSYISAKKIGNFYDTRLGIGISDLEPSLQDKIEHDSIHYLDSYESIEYDKNSQTYQLNTTNISKTKEKYRINDIVLSPSLNNIFKISSNLNYNPTPPILLKLDNNDSNNFEFDFNAESEAYHLTGFNSIGINETTGQNEYELYLSAINLLRNNNNLKIKINNFLGYSLEFTGGTSYVTNVAGNKFYTIEFIFNYQSIKYCFTWNLVEQIQSGQSNYNIPEAKITQLN